MAARARFDIWAGEGVGVGVEGLVGDGGDASGSTIGGVRDPEAALSSRVNVVAEVNSSSSSSVNTFKSPGVKVEPAARDRLLEEFCRKERSRAVEPPVILEILYVEKRFDARRSNASLFLRAAKELAMAGAARASKGGVSGGEGELIRALT